MMDEKLRQRLIGATVLVGLGVIFIPMLLDNSNTSAPKTELPARPGSDFASRVVPLERQPTDSQANKREGSLKRPPQAKVELKSDSVMPVVPIKEGVAETVISPEDGMQPGGQGGKEAKTPIKLDLPPSLLSPSAASERAQAAGWAIQLASFGSEEKAVALKERLQKRGYNAFVEGIRVNRGKVFRVRVGPVPQTKAKEIQTKLARDVNLKGIVVRYP